MVFSVFLFCKGCVTGVCFGVPVCMTFKRQDRDERYLEHSNLFWFLTWKTEHGLNVFHSLVMVCYTGVSMLYRGCCWDGLALGAHTHTHTFTQAGRHAHYTGMQFRYIWYTLSYLIPYKYIYIYVTVSDLSPIRLHNPSRLYMFHKKRQERKG